MTSSDIGVFEKPAASADAWHVAAEGLPAVVVNDLAFHSATRTLYAGTHGRSIYQLSISMPVSVETQATEHATESASLQSVPNPFRKHTRLHFQCSKHEMIALSIVDLNGKTVATPPIDRQSNGACTAIWHGRSTTGTPVSRGVYFWVLQTSSGTRTAKILRL